MKTITFFNNKGGVGKTTCVYHVAWMLSELGYRTVAVDLDPQSNLTSFFLNSDRLEDIYSQEAPPTLLNSITPVVSGEPYRHVYLEHINENLALVIGDLSLSTLEDKLSKVWLECLNRDIYSFKVTSIFNTIIEDAAHQFQASFVLVDVGPNLGAINRSVTISSDYIVMPVASDLFSLQGIKNLGQTLHHWKKEWKDRQDRAPQDFNIKIPDKEFLPAGYIIMQYKALEGRPVKSYIKWAERIPTYYAEHVLHTNKIPESVDADPNCIGLLKHYYSLAPMSMEAHKPMFLLRPADGAIGAHMESVNKCYDDFKKLTLSIVNRCSVTEIAN
ncbi:MAG: AAA family ATPase [Cyclobacteriaceae bacterium]|nr:AAA family ATPase [Cyclobacteriaceae bacterium]MDW8331228.1 AAA family ATPase [Cyclobacteriaceae bacterium]